MSWLPDDVSLPDETILVVDNNPASRMYLANYLRTKQVQVLDVPLGEEGLIAAWCDGPDLILFDLTPEAIADQEFIHKLRNEFCTAQT